MENKTKGELLQEELLLKAENATNRLSDEEIQKVYDFCEPYKKFMDSAKIENEAVRVTVEMLEKNDRNGFGRLTNRSKD